jgi:hypothetical protein
MGQAGAPPIKRTWLLIKVTVYLIQLHIEIR